MEKTIYELDLNEYLIIEESEIEKTSVTRVPGGWIYTVSNWMKSDNGAGVAVGNSSVFVPMNDEFKIKQPVKVRSSSVGRR